MDVDTQYVEEHLPAHTLLYLVSKDGLGLVQDPFSWRSEEQMVYGSVVQNSKLKNWIPANSGVWIWMEMSTPIGRCIGIWIEMTGRGIFQLQLKEIPQG